MRWASWLLPVTALGVVAAVVAMAAARGSGASGPVAHRAISVKALIRPHVALFGGTVRAELRIAVDQRRVNPRRVRVTAELAPFSQLGPVRVRREPSGPVTLIRISYRLQCVAAACSRPARQASLTLRPAVVRWGTHRLLVTWPRATIASRVTARDLAHPALRYTTDSPAHAYRADPVVVGWTAIGGAAVLILTLGVFVPAKLRHTDAPVEPPSSDLERALAHVVEAAGGSQADRRGAIGDLAQALERDGFGELAPLARRIAWSSGGPSPALASELALLVRAALEVAR